MDTAEDLGGKTFVITGATSGIGWETALRLAARGARLALVGRDRRLGEAAIAAIKDQTPGCDVRIHYADLSRLDEVRRLAGDLLAALPRIDVLINNAGAIFRGREVTADGLERTFALNHMAYFVLTDLLRARLIASAPARIVNVASEAHRGASARLRRSADRAPLHRLEGLQALEARQHPVHARAGAAAGGDRGDRQLPAPGLCRQPIRRQHGRRVSSGRESGQAPVCNFARERGQDVPPRGDGVRTRDHVRTVLC